ncbi:MAG TPA: LLM class F420-dependent oxidoreductase [Streptosporangiaceae bacterium]|nr:LLM class F420-dependent oxidoreductase [Streptosporangiaceae bacterium]
MTSQKRWGLTLPLNGVPVAEQRDLVASLPGLGYTDAWSAELNGVDAFTPLAFTSEWAPELRLGTAIVGIYGRAPVTLAVQAATLADLAPGRFVMGIGTSSKVAVEQWNGIPFEKPYQRSRDLLRFLREALAGGKVTRQYETFSVDGFRLDPAPKVPPALALAALRPGMVKLAAAEAGIAITNWLSPADVTKVREVAGTDCELVARIFVIPTADEDMARLIGRRVIAAYLTVPVYAAFHEWLGRGDVIAPMLAAWAAGDRRGAVEAIPDSLVDELVIHGPAEHCRERVAAYHVTGLDTPVIAILPTPGINLPDTLAKLAPA